MLVSSFNFLHGVKSWPIHWNCEIGYQTLDYKVLKLLFHKTKQNYKIIIEL